GSLGSRLQQLLVGALDQDRAAEDPADDVAGDARRGVAVAVEVAQAQARQAGGQAGAQLGQAVGVLGQAQRLYPPDLRGQDVGINGNQRRLVHTVAAAIQGQSRVGGVDSQLLGLLVVEVFDLGVAEVEGAGRVVRVGYGPVHHIGEGRGEAVVGDVGAPRRHD